MYNKIPIVRISQLKQNFHINWRVDLRCNFDCMYCPSNFHDLTSKTKTFEQLKDSWIKIFEKSQTKNLKYFISFTGGEITINKDFLPFIIWLQKNYQTHIDKITVSTNGSASTKYYKKLLNYVDSISFSTHSEFFNENKFFTNVVKCNEFVKNTSKTVQVCLMNEPWHHDRLKIYIDFLEKNTIMYTVNEIDWNWKIRNEHKQNKNSQYYEFQ